MDASGDVDMGAGREAVGGEDPQMEKEREKHRRRAQRFGTEYVDPAKRSDTKKKNKTGNQKQKKEKGNKGKNWPAGARGGANASQVQISAEELEARKRRAEKFGPVQDMQPALKKLKLINRPFPERLLLEGRIDADPSFPRRLDTVHMYGVDLMNSKDVLRYFTDYGPKYVEWINDSSCNIVFGDGGSAMHAILGMGTAVSVPKAGASCQPTEPQGQAAASTGLRPQSESVIAETDGSKMDTDDSKGETSGTNTPPDPSYIGMYEWHRGPPFIKSKEAPAIHLMFRMATTEDRKQDAPKQTRKLWRLPMSKATRIQKWDATEGGRAQQQKSEGQEKKPDATASSKKNLRKRQRRKAQKDKEAAGQPKTGNINGSDEGQTVDDLRDLITRLQLSPPSGKDGRNPSSPSKTNGAHANDAFTMGAANNEPLSGSGNVGEAEKLLSCQGEPVPMEN
ncbi:unnamed protein product [Ostreobium quekettii]|uniref:Nuclear cap-binding protein subunit 3 n=1 Tax=Ostreobium quekettii TaxID=121088 RepID=A0A8S1IV18_9CHLO|nr:unnamed protein product [Ostreobium quekettii]|eukprot:evm.model.scf_934EXC.4 EVM.evm.TU.scf_934EXC.4   scf_934EXC:20145-24792(-)